MNIAVLSLPDSWYFRDLQRAAGHDHTVTPCSFNGISATLGTPSEPGVHVDSRRATDFDAVLVRSMPPGSLEQVVFRMDALAAVARAGTPVINPPRALEIAIDKYLTLDRLAEAGLTVPPTITCQSWEAAMEAFLLLGRDVVVKPLFGGEGRGIARLTDEELAQRAFKMLAQLGAVLYLQKFLPHAGYDLRVLVVGDQLLGMRRENPRDWRSNISRGAVACPATLDARHERLARRAARVLGTPIAGVDLLEADDGRIYVLEVNAVPGWRALSRVCRVDVAALVIRWLETHTTRDPGPVQKWEVA
jgi:RimK family alpha-L-glutamate ligase